MPPLIPCPACERHVYSNESACPFCKAALPKRRSVGPGVAAAAGLALMATGCPDRGDAPAAEYGAPMPPSISAPASDTADPASADPPSSEPVAEPSRQDDGGGGEVYGAPPPPPGKLDDTPEDLVEPEVVEPDDSK